VIQHLVAAAAYAGMVLAAAVIAAVEYRGRHRALRGARHLLIVWVVGATLLAGVSQRDLWPLSSWSLMTHAPRRDMGVDPVYLRLLAVDGAGREYPVDYRAVEPFAIEELMAWMRRYFLKLPGDEQDRVADFLLRRLNLARARVLAGDEPGTQGRWLGPLRAPFHALHPRQWTSIHSVPTTPFVALRVYGEIWDLEERAVDPSRVTRTRLYEYRESAVP
jgi:hypothetical protein